MASGGAATLTARHRQRDRRGPENRTRRHLSPAADRAQHRSGGLWRPAVDPAQGQARLDPRFGDARGIPTTRHFELR